MGKNDFLEKLCDNMNGYEKWRNYSKLEAARTAITEYINGTKEPYNELLNLKALIGIYGNNWNNIISILAFLFSLFTFLISSANSLLAHDIGVNLLLIVFFIIIFVIFARETSKGKYREWLQYADVCIEDFLDTWPDVLMDDNDIASEKVLKQKYKKIIVPDEYFDS